VTKDQERPGSHEVRPSARVVAVTVGLRDFSSNLLSGEFNRLLHLRDTASELVGGRPTARPILLVAQQLREVVLNLSKDERPYTAACAEQSVRALAGT
jgi:hypothetical protein